MKCFSYLLCMLFSVMRILERLVVFHPSSSELLQTLVIPQGDHVLPRIRKMLTKRIVVARRIWPIVLQRSDPHELVFSLTEENPEM